MNIIADNIGKIRALCQKHKVSRLFVFGSVLTDKFRADSDVDFAVDFKDVPLYDYADNYFNLRDSLQMIMGRQVDLVEYKSVSNPYFRESLDATKQMIYG